MAKSIIGGALGGGAIKRISNIVHFGRIKGKIHINQAQEKEIIDRTTKVFGKDGKSPYQIPQRKIDEEILNPLALRHVHGFNIRKAAEVEKALGMTEHTNQIGGRYSDILKHDIEVERQKHVEVAPEAEKKVNRFVKSEDRFSRLDKMLDSVKDMQFGTGDMIYDEHLGKMVPKTPEQKAHDLHSREMPKSPEQRAHDLHV